MSSWVDADISEVVAQWGEPDEVRQSERNQVYVWNHLIAPAAPEITVRTFGISTHIGSSGSATTGGGTQGENCQRILEVNAQGKVVDWQWRGDRCPYREDGPYATWRKKQTVSNRTTGIKP